MENQSKKIEDTPINTLQLDSEADHILNNPEETAMQLENKANDGNQSNNNDSINSHLELAKHSIKATPDLSDGPKLMDKPKDKIEDSEKKTEEAPVDQTFTKKEEVKHAEKSDKDCHTTVSESIAMPKPPNMVPKEQPLPEELKSKIRRVPVSQWRAKNVDEYDMITLIGRGTFGKVFKAKLKNPTNTIEANEVVALKKLNMTKEEEGFPITALREIQILKKLKHNNVVNLKDIVVQRRKHRSCNEYST
jgi:hypothetical protein